MMECIIRPWWSGLKLSILTNPTFRTFSLKGKVKKKEFDFFKLFILKLQWILIAIEYDYILHLIINLCSRYVVCANNFQILCESQYSFVFMQLRIQIVLSFVRKRLMLMIMYQFIWEFVLLINIKQIHRWVDVTEQNRWKTPA